jgi:hypothetical protein
VSDDNLVTIPRDALLDLISVTRSINNGKQHEIRLPGEDEPCYWQRKEWVDWAVGAGELVAQELARLNPESLPASGPAPEPENPKDAEKAAVGWTDFSHDGQRWSFDATQLAQWDEDEEEFHFFSYHGLTEPTEDTVISYIQGFKKC